MTDPTGLSATFQSLPPTARLVALGYGVVHPYDLTPTQMAQLLFHARFTRRGEPVPSYGYKVACDDVLDADIIYRTTRQGRLVAAPEWAPWLTIEAFRQGKLERIEAALSAQTSPYRRFEDLEAYAMRLRCDTVAGRFDRVERRAGDVEPFEWDWLSEPGAGDLLAELPGVFLGDALSVCFDHVIQTAAPPEPFVEVWRARAAESPGSAADVAFIRVLQGRGRDALAVYDELPPELREAKPARVGLAATRALLATVRGDDAEAIRFIEETIAAEKAGTRKRNVFPASRAFVFSLLSLVRDHTPRNAAELDRLVTIGRKQYVRPLFLRVVSAAVLARDGYVFSLNVFAAAEPVFTRFFDGLGCCWIDDFEPFDQERTTGLRGFAIRAAEHGYLWMAAECFEILSRMEAGAFRVNFGGEPLAAGDAADALHERLGTTTLASLVAPVPEWEYPLKEIEQFAYETKKKKPKRKKSAATGPGRRLAWVLRVDAHGDVTVSPKEQRGYKNGKWSKGRAVGLQRLHSKAATMDFLVKQDRAAAGRIVHNTQRWSGQPTYYIPSAGLYELAGHPYVFNEEGHPVEIVRREVELLIEERDGVLFAQVRPHTDDATTEHYDIFMVGDARCEVTHFTAGHKRLCGIIPVVGIGLPVEAKDRLLDAVSALAAEIRVQGVIGAGAGVATQVDADPRPWVRLEPSGPGLAVAVLVEPVPESGTYFHPGAGGTTVFASANGDSVQARRDLDAETRAVQALVLACPMLAGIGPDSSLTLPDPGDCLELVDQLGAANARCLWPKGEPFKVVARAGASSLRLTVKSAADWFTASGALAIDSERALDLRRLLELMDRSPGTRFVELGDGAFVSLTAAFRRQLDDLRSLSAPSGKKRLRLHAMAALALRDFMDDTKLTTDAGWRTQRERLRDAQAFEPEVPSTLQAELRPYQEEGFRWLARLSHWGAGACLADDMGLGKTVQTLAVLLERAPQGPALVVAPTSVVANWVDEARRFAPTLNVRTYTGPAASRARRLEGLGPFDVVVTTYGLLQIDSKILAAIEWSTAVLDEAQAIKNPATKRARAARNLTAGFRVVTTGTPIQNNLLDLYSLFGFINPGMLGSQKRFRENFALPVERDGDPAARARLRRLIAPFVLRRLKADVLDDLPPRTEVTLHVEMSPEEAALYEALRRRAMDDLDALADGGAASGRQRLQVLAHLTRLRLACCNPRLVHPDGAPASSKLETFAATLDELRESRHKVLVFSQFVRHLKLIEEHLVEAGIPYQYLDGATSAKARAERIAAFQAGRGDAFLISLRAGGVGLNLTAADYVIHMDPWWNPAAEDQASDRAHRIGQTRPVTIYRLVAKGTIEEQIVDLHRHKRDLADRLLEGADAPARLSADELLKLLRDPVGSGASPRRPPSRSRAAG